MYVAKKAKQKPKYHLVFVRPVFLQPVFLVFRKKLHFGQSGTSRGTLYFIANKILIRGCTNLRFKFTAEYVAYIQIASQFVA